MRRQPGTEAGSNLELGLRLGGSAREEHLHLSPLASVLMQPQARKKSRGSATRAGSVSRIQAWVGKLDSRSGARIA
jgi:hypothetical protein